MADLAKDVREGLSPRRRGNRQRTQLPVCLRGPIPAKAGEPPRESATASTSRAYPREGGGTNGTAKIVART